MADGKNNPNIIGDKKNYKIISNIILFFLFLNSLMILLLNSIQCVDFLNQFFPKKIIFVIQIYFWASLAGTISSSLFMKGDNEINEIESIKEKPNPFVLRYPTKIDIHLYIHRIITSGLLGVVGALILFAGLGYFDVSTVNLNIKQKLFMIVFCFLCGLYHRNFIEFLSKLSSRFLKNKIGNKDGVEDHSDNAETK
jgi:hypothetical protein